MMHEATRVLARNHACEVQLCEGCNVLHLVVGPVTLRLDPSAARLVVGALGQAVRALPPATPTVSVNPIPGTPVLN